MSTTGFMKLYDELGRLNEDNYTDSRAFWNGASNKKIYDKNFHRAFDAELQDLGLMDIFAEDGSIADQSSYGRIKAAKEANPDSWAVKALQKFWVLQFKDGVKLDSVIQQEKAEAERLEREARYAKEAEERRIELEAKNAQAEADYEVIEKNLPEIKASIEKQVADMVESKRQLLIADFKKIIELRDEIDVNTRNMIDRRYDNRASMLEYLEDGEDLYTLKINLPPIDKRFPRARLEVTLAKLFKITPTWEQYTSFGGNTKVFDTLVFTAKDVEEGTIESRMAAWLDKIWEAVNSRVNRLDEAQKEYDSIMSKVKAAKEAQAAVDADRPVDPKFISDVLDELGEGIKYAEREYDLYRDVHDGSSGAAYVMAEARTVESVALTLVNCNWRAYTDQKEVASWRMTDSINDLYDAVDDAFNAYKSGGLHLEIVK